MQLWIVIHANEQRPLVIPFRLRWGGKKKKNSYQSWREEWEADMSTGCSRTLASTWQGERSATESRGRHTGVGEHSAPRLMAPWCLWDKTEVSRTHCAVQGLLKMCQQSLYLTFPLLLMHYITETDVVASTRSDLIGCLSKFFLLFFKILNTKQSWPYRILLNPPWNKRQLFIRLACLISTNHLWSLPSPIGDMRVNKTDGSCGSNLKLHKRVPGPCRAAGNRRILFQNYDYVSSANGNVLNFRGGEDP